jgi:GWxTD domain-containing protein
LRHIALISLLLGGIWLNAQNLTSYFDHKVFQVPDQGILLETYVDIVGPSAVFIPKSDSTLQANIEVEMVIKEGSKTIDSSREIVLSPLTLPGYSPNFMYINRFLLPKGNYTLELTMKDLNSDLPAISTVRNLDLDRATKDCRFSDIELIAGFRQAGADSKLAKSGLEFIPYLSNLYDRSFSEIIFYVELYNIDHELGDDVPFLFKYAIVDANTEIPWSECEVFKRKKTAQVITELGRIDISTLPSGLFDLVVEARNREDELISKERIRIVRESDVVREYTDEEIDLTFVGDLNDKDSLIAFIECLTPIAGERERAIIDYQVKGFTLLECKSFFYSFWENRSLADPSAAWQDYKTKVNLAQEQFGTSNKYGYMTDMGRVFLKYGEPNSIANRSNDPESYPYQIWHYYKAGKFNDKRFVFYDKELLQREYVLLHSDVPGEVRNPRWDLIINSRNNAQWNIDQERAGGRSSDQLQELFEAPR